jgi:hypothetical protein
MKGIEMIKSYSPGPWVTASHVEVGDFVFIEDTLIEVAWVGSFDFYDASGNWYSMGQLAVEDDWSNPFVRRTIANELAQRGLDIVGMVR